MSDAVDTAIDLFKTLVWDNLIKAALADLFASVPLLGWGPIGYVITALVIRFSDKLYAGVKLFIEVKEIVFKNESLKNEYGRRSVELKIVAHDYGILSPEFEKAHEKNRNAMADFVRFDVARRAG